MKTTVVWIRFDPASDLQDEITAFVVKKFKRTVDNCSWKGDLWYEFKTTTKAEAFMNTIKKEFKKDEVRVAISVGE